MTDTTKLAERIEAVAQAIWKDMLVTGLANDVRGWGEREFECDEWRQRYPAIDNETKNRVRSAAAAAIRAREAHNG